MTQPQDQNTKQPLTAKRYFAWVGLLTFLAISLFLSGQKVFLLNTAAKAGLLEPIVASETSFYSTRVQPILTKYCVECHGADKIKGDLRLDGYVQTLHSGANDVIRDYAASDSSLITRMALPKVNLEAMPPLGLANPTDEEMLVLKLWIEAGASGTSLPSDFPDAPALIEEIQIPTIDQEAIAKERAVHEKVFAEIDNEFPHMISYISTDSALLRVTNFSLQGEFDGYVLKKIEPLAAKIASIYLRGATIDDDGAAIIATMRNIEEATLVRTRLSKVAVLSIVQNLPKLQRLTLDKKLITDTLRSVATAKNIRLYGVTP